MTKLREKISNVLVAFTKNNVDAEKEIRKIIEGYIQDRSRFEKYAPEYKVDAFRETVNLETKPIIENVNYTNMLYNQKVKAIIAEEKQNILPKTIKKEGDYAIKVSNALKYLEIEGEKLTDEIAFDILKDFIDDYKQMKLFKQVIKRNMKLETLEDSEGKNIFPKTFGKFNKIEMFINTFDEMETIANTLFLTCIPKKEIYFFYNARVQIPLLSVPGYTELSNEDEIIKLAEIIDSETKEIDSIIMEKNRVNITE